MQDKLYKLDIGAIRFLVMTNRQTIVKNFFFKADSNAQNVLRFHSHHNYELFAVIDSEMTVNTEKTSYKCRNSIILIPPNNNHYINFENTTAVALNFVPQVLNKSSEAVYNSIIKNISNEISIFDMTPNELIYCNRLIEADGENTFVDVEPHLISLLLIEILSRFAPSDKSPQKQNKNQYTTTIDAYVATHLSEKIHLQNLSDELHLCPKQVSRIIKKEYGCTLSELVTKHRMSVASMLLTTTNMKVYEISDSVGYESPIDFRNNFKNTYGVTPTEYKKQKTSGFQSSRHTQ